MSIFYCLFYFLFKYQIKIQFTFGVNCLLSVWHCGLFLLAKILNCWANFLQIHEQFFLDGQNETSFLAPNVCQTWELVHTGKKLTAAVKCSLRLLTSQNTFTFPSIFRDMFGIFRGISKCLLAHSTTSRGTSKHALRNPGWVTMTLRKPWQCVP